MRTETRETAIVAGSYNIECCPFVNVDDELEYINQGEKRFLFILCPEIIIDSFHLLLVVYQPTYMRFFYLAMYQVMEKPFFDCKLDTSRTR